MNLQSSDFITLKDDVVASLFVGYESNKARLGNRRAHITMLMKDAPTGIVVPIPNS